jgi:multimeric flavodoxin WrbA
MEETAMKIVVINGTEIKGCTFHMKETFMSAFKDKNEIIEFYLPKDMPYFCSGCKTCFFKDEKMCPHAKVTMPIWNAILEANLIVFAFPVYALRAPGQVKALLDHLCCHWMVHRPEKEMFLKRAVIITNSIGAPNRAAQKDVITSLNWLGVSSVTCVGAGLMEGVIWEELSDKRKDILIRKVEAVANKYKKHTNVFQPANKSFKIFMLFAISKMMHKSILKNEETPSADNLHWIKNGWIKAK